MNSNTNSNANANNDNNNSNNTSYNHNATSVSAFEATTPRRISGDCIFQGVLSQPSLSQPSKFLI